MSQWRDVLGWLGVILAMLVVAWVVLAILTLLGSVVEKGALHCREYGVETGECVESLTTQEIIDKWKEQDNG